jgi:DNA-binding XRE family transcriptional regulator
MVTLDAETFWILRRVLPAATKDCLRETFGVSETTWVKLRDGRPVKQITLARLMIRYQRLLEDELSRTERISSAA